MADAVIAILYSLSPSYHHPTHHITPGIFFLQQKEEWNFRVSRHFKRFFNVLSVNSGRLAHFPTSFKTLHKKLLLEWSKNIEAFSESVQILHTKQK